ncbi:autotransporter outer membrane beta-barrel domain-containing protein [Neorhizobium sp. CSC1952]|uniref:autotransporter family protein n=1 Tax=Neorhizobium sp. CSC1952 TaxID=2978974 RepID=UPI0025A626B8|nr:autotransporter outer membrane beta-barrel domain-containing protein [Rhizobium sp. CSC1952]WJR65193.1 autotransporter outer membrane beta-barrel domain-containing protein [Rhizobium sp. CSC1952]
MNNRTDLKVLRRFLLSGTGVISGAVLFSADPAQACSFAAPVGNDNYVCDSGTSIGGLTDTGGNNTLLLPPSGTGTIAGNVVFGAGADTIEIHSGTISGTVNQGDGADTFIISGGSVTGNVQQGSGADDFQMSGGEIFSLSQGDNLDTFRMTGGRIIDSFEDGDYAEMTGGRIGRVNMKLDDNTFDMSGGIIDKNLVTGFGNDTIILSGGTIGGNISVSGGTDSVTVTGGTIGGEVRLSVGSDTFTWNGGGIIYGLVDLGGDNDTASLSNLTNSNIGATPQITGGLGTDAITFDNVKTGDVARFDSWETIDLTNDTQLIFDETLTLGDSGTGTGSLTVDAASTIYGGGANGGIAAFTAGQLVEVVNAGRLDLTNGGDGATDTFTIGGNYTGNGGQIFLNTVLGDDSSASDRLIVGGDASGTTGLNIVNAGGAGDVTTQDGIMVVDVGGTSADGAFALNGRVAAGAYEYYLFKGGVSANTEDNWYLRSTLVTPPAAPPPEPAAAPDPVSPPAEEPQPEEPEVAPPPPASELPAVDPPTEGDPVTEPVDPTPPVAPSDPEPEAPPAPPPAEPAEPPPPPPAPPTAPAPVPVPGGTAIPPTPGATPVIAEVVPLYRMEVPTYSVVPPAAHHLALSTLGTFHERRGEQILLQDGGWLPTSWGRAFGQDAEMGWDGTVSPSFDGNLFGFQAGQDLFGYESGGHFDRFGLFFGYAKMDGDVKGQALGWNDLAVGDINISGTSFGGYWSHIGPQGWYVDAILMGTWFDGSASSNAGQSIGIDGTSLTASLEGGYPIALDDQWSLEPQGQIVWQRLSLDDSSDRFSSVSFDSDNAVTGRLGLRLQGKYQTDAGLIQPYLKANLWHNFSSDQTIRFDGDPITTEIGGTSLEIGGGVIANLTEKVSLFATVDYTTNLGGEKTRIWEGNIGISIKW